MSVNGAQGTSTADVYMRMSDRQYQQTLSDAQKDYSIFIQQGGEASQVAQVQENEPSGIVDGVFQGAGSVVGGVFGGVGDVVGGVVGGVKDIFSGNILGGIGDVVGGIFSGVGKVVGGVVDGVKNVFQGIGNFFSGIFGG